MSSSAGKLSYPVPWKAVMSLGRHIAKGTQTSVDDFSAAICARMTPAPAVTGEDQLPPSARFVLVANHYQRKGMWILHPAAALTQAIRRQYGLGDPPVRWMVTANWPRLRTFGASIPSPGDVLLPRVAHALACYPVSTVGGNANFTARSLRRILRDFETCDRPLGLFPEGVAGTASVLSPPLPGIDRLVALLARKGLPVQPAGISETDRLQLRFGPTISCAELVATPDAAALVMQRIADLLG